MELIKKMSIHILKTLKVLVKLCLYMKQGKTRKMDYSGIWVKRVIIERVM